MTKYAQIACQAIGDQNSTSYLLNSVNEVAPMLSERCFRCAKRKRKTNDFLVECMILSQKTRIDHTFQLHFVHTNITLSLIETNN